VWLNPYSDRVHICPNPIAMPLGAREFIVEGTTRPGIHPMLVTKHRVTTSFLSDATPKSVIVYSMGVDAPNRQEVQVATSPPPAMQPAAQADEQSAPATTPAASGSSGTAIVGYSESYSFEEAVNDALTKAAALDPVTPQTADHSIVIEVTKITAKAKGSMPAGLYLTANLVK
jgi:hypothetical protein